MKYLPSEINERIISILEEKFGTVLIESIENHIEFMNSIADLREAFPDYDENAMIVNTESARIICGDINSLLENHFQKDDSLGFERLFPNLLEELDKLFADVKPIIDVEQDETRFKPLSTDNPFINFAKRIKSIVLKILQSIIKTINFILIRIKRKPLEIRYWSQRIPLKNIGLYFLRNKLLKKLSLVYEDVYKKISFMSVAFWNIDESYEEDYISTFIAGTGMYRDKKEGTNPENIIEELVSLKNEVNEKLLEALNECDEEIDIAFQKVGTIELSQYRFNSRKVINDLNTIKNEFEKIIKEWDNTLYALGQDWELNYDLESIRYSTIEVFLKFNKSLSVKNKLQIYPHFNEISSSLKSVSTKLDNSVSNLLDFERQIVIARDSLQKVLLSSTLPNLINSISDLKLNDMINEAKRTIKNQIRFIKETRVFVETAKYDKRIKSSNMDEIYPREFISFNTLPRFLTSLDKIKEISSTELKKIQSELINLGNIVDFSLESAVTGATKEKFSQSEIKDIALDGIKMTQDKRDQLLNSFDSICENVLKDLKTAVANYCEELFGLTQSSKIIEIKIHLAKAKAKAKVKETRGKLFLTLKKFIPKIFNKIRFYNSKLFKFYSVTRTQFGLTDTKEAIDSDISDFLSRANTTIKKLPYIYHRLFQLSPLENDRLYVTKEYEESQLNIAYTKWTEGGYAPVIITAEKGGGITSFLNIYSTKHINKIITKRLNLNPTVTNEADFIKILQDLFLPKRFLNFDDFIKHLNSSENKQIIIVENLQHLYLRSSKGFVCLNLLVDLISKTNKNIFWIVSSTLYANDYLSKTIRLNDVFGYHVTFKQLRSDQIIDLIKKRNSISGYNLIYEIDPALARKKEINKLSFTQQQIFLEKQFFNSLNKFAQSNVSLALLFWLRSIKDIQERQVHINADFQISDTILTSLSSEKVFILQSLLLHDGLKIPAISQTINISLKETREIVQILYDDGVLIKNNEVLFINPLLYRQSVILLKSKNLI